MNSFVKAPSGPMSGGWCVRSRFYDPVAHVLSLGSSGHTVIKIPFGLLKKNLNNQWSLPAPSSRRQMGCEVVIGEEESVIPYPLARQLGFPLGVPKTIDVKGRECLGFSGYIGVQFHRQWDVVSCVVPLKRCWNDPIALGVKGLVGRHMICLTADEVVVFGRV